MIEQLKNIVDLAPLVGSAPISGVRYNPWKIQKEDFERLFALPLEENPYYPAGYRVRGEVSGLGKTPLHQGGACYFQEPSAMSAVTALAVQDGQRVLDLCAAPGSKATALAALVPNGILVANEIHSARAKILAGNLERMGVGAALVTNCAPAVLNESFENYFDRILVDSPCSGEGMFRKYPEILENWSAQLVAQCAARSREILEAAAGMLRPGGRMVYSTCTFNEEENEKTVQHFLKHHPEFFVVPHGIPEAQAGRCGLHEAARIFPDTRGEGHFVCAMEKKNKDFAEKYTCFTPDALPSQAADCLAECVLMPPAFYGGKRSMIYKIFGDTVYIVPEDLPSLKKGRMLRTGIGVAYKKGKLWHPSHHLFTATPIDRFCRTLTVDDRAAEQFLAGQTLPCDTRGYTAVLWQGLCLGFGKASGGILKNHYPKGLRTI